MARKSMLRFCKRCRKEAHCGVVTSFYVLRSADDEKNPSTGSRNQIKGSLPTYGLCKRCLVALAEKRQVTAADLKALRLLLGLSGSMDSRAN
jgi:hypothetical protein